LNRGQRLVELLKQNQFSPLPFSKQILIIMAGTGGFLDDLPVNQVRDFEAELYKYVDSTRIPRCCARSWRRKVLDDALKAQAAERDQRSEAAVCGSREAVAK
jgi:F-type H+/Na+-transporting ATPase subunit alpha